LTISIGMTSSNGNYALIQVVEHKSKSNKKEFIQNFESIGSAVLYGISSTSMAFANKTVITSYQFDFPFFIMACQMMLCIIFLEVLRIYNVVYIPKYSLKLGQSFLWPSVFYALHAISALYALGGMSIPIDIEFEMRAYTYGAVSVLVQGLYLTLAQKSLEEMSALLVLYISCYNTIPLFVFIGLLYEGQSIVKFENFSDSGFLLCFFIQVVTGVLLNYSLFLCTAKNSALTTSLVGVLKSVLQTTIGFFTFGGVEFNSLNIFGIGLNMLGGIMYTYTKYMEKFK
ncbi:hypothetical protein CEXT_520981, partial [Caerostris extrusa]